MTHQPGTRIGPYEIVAPLGAGGMGEVYRAMDTRLRREVALKFVAASLAHDPASLASFAREAQVLASLNHPNIATIYGVDDQALAMELVEGPTLAERLKKGPVPLDQALGIARQIADALEAAHDKGIVHRDLKPANIKITPAGTVKLLDFGLARAAAAAAAVPDDAMTVAMSMALGSIVGTPGYMAPEQARGQQVDKRADIWAFGVVLYEMVTGTTLFQGDTTTDIMAAVVREEPDLARAPAPVRPLLRRCLEKDPKKRLRDIGDAMLMLDGHGEALVAEAPTPRGGRLLWIAGGAAALAATALAVVSLVHFRETPPPRNPLRFTIRLPQGVTFTQIAPFAISPDGRKLAFPAVGAEGSPRVWVQGLDAAEPRPLADVSPNPSVMAWSPDSRFVLFSHDQKLKRVDAEGDGPVQTMFAPEEGPPLSAAWHPDGTLVVSTLAGLLKVENGGAGAAAPVTRTNPGELQAVLGFLPGTRDFFYTRSGPIGSRRIFIGSLDAAPEDQAEEAVLATDLGAMFVPGRDASADDRLLFMRDGALMAQRFDLDTRQLAGDPQPVAEEVFFSIGPTSGYGYYSASAEGTLVYRSGTIAGLARQLAWFGRDGRPLGTMDEWARFQQLKLSPDSTRLVASRTELETGNNADLWITDLETQTNTRLTFGGGAHVQPTWSPDGSHVAWASVREGVGGIYRKRADGAGAEELLYRFPTPMGAVIVSDWSRDGEYLVLARGGDIFALPIGPKTDSTRQPIAIVNTPAREFGPDLSPDSRWLAYVADNNGRQQLYVEPFAPGGQGPGSGGKWMVSPWTLGMARWRGDGKELLFVNADGALMSVDVGAGAAFDGSSPRALFTLPRPFLVQTGNPGTLGDISHDGQRVLLAMPSELSTRPELTVLVNWMESLRSE